MIYYICISNIKLILKFCFLVTGRQIGGARSNATMWSLAADGDHMECFCRLPKTFFSYQTARCLHRRLFPLYASRSSRVSHRSRCDASCEIGRRAHQRQSTSAAELSTTYVVERYKGNSPQFRLPQTHSS